MSRGTAHRRARQAAAFVVRTNVPPLSWVYDAAYAAAIYGLALAFRIRLGSKLRTVYLRRSLTQKFRVNGLSDVDLCLVLKDDATREDRERAMRLFGLIRSQVPLLDEHPEAFTLEDLRWLHRHDLRYYYRFIEGRAGWRPLLGEDVIRGLPREPERDLAASFCELRTYWTLFNRAFLHPREEDALEKRAREYLLFKCICDFMRAALQDATGALLFDRLEIVRAFRRERAARAGDRRFELGGRLLPFLEYSASRRFRRPYQKAQPEEWSELLERQALPFLLEVTGSIVRGHREELRAGLGDERGKFYTQDRSRLSGRALRRLPRSDCLSVGKLRQAVLEAESAGLDAVLEEQELLICFSNLSLPDASATVVVS